MRTNLALEVRKPASKLIFIMLLDRFVSLLLILSPLTLLLISVLSLFSYDLNHFMWINVDRVIILNMEVSRATILQKLLINCL